MIRAARLKRFTPRKLMTTGKANRLVDAINGIQSDDPTGIVDGGTFAPARMQAVVWDAGPSGEADYSASSGGRYWVRATTIGAGQARDAITLNNVGLTGSSGGDDQLYLFTATNLPETASGTPRHTLRKGTPVEVRIEVDAGGVPRYVFDYPPPLIIPVTLATDGGVTGNQTTQCSWTYTATALDGSTVLATGLTYDPRPDVGEVKAGTRGELVWFSGAWKLWLCNEVANAKACS